MPLPVGFFMPMAFPAMAPYMWYQSAMIGEGFYMNGKIAERRIGAMPNDYFKEGGKAMSYFIEIQRKDMQAYIDALPKMFAQARQVNHMILEELVTMLGDAIKLGLEVLVNQGNYGELGRPSAGNPNYFNPPTADQDFAPPGHNLGEAFGKWMSSLFTMPAAYADSVKTVHRSTGEQVYPSLPVPNQYISPATQQIMAAQPQGPTKQFEVKTRRDAFFRDMTEYMRRGHSSQTIFKNLLKTYGEKEFKEYDSTFYFAQAKLLKPNTANTAKAKLENALQNAIKEEQRMMQEINKVKIQLKAKRAPYINGRRYSTRQANIWVTSQEEKLKTQQERTARLRSQVARS